VKTKEERDKLLPILKLFIMDNFYSKLFLVTHGLNVVALRQISAEVLG